MGQVEELIGSSVCNNIGVDIDDLAELSLPPQVDLSEGRVKVRAVHEVQVCRVVIAYATDGDDMVVHSLRNG